MLISAVVSSNSVLPVPGKASPRDSAALCFIGKVTKHFFVFGFPKSGLDNIRVNEEEQFKKAAKLVLALSDDRINQLIENGQFEEVIKDD